MACTNSIFVFSVLHVCYLLFLFFVLPGTNWYWANYASRFSTCAVQRLSNVSARTHVTTWPSSLSGLIIQTTSRKLDPVLSVVVFPDNSKWSFRTFVQRPMQHSTPPDDIHTKNCNCSGLHFFSDASVFETITENWCMKFLKRLSNWRKLEEKEFHAAQMLCYYLTFARQLVVQQPFLSVISLLPNVNNAVKVPLKRAEVHQKSWRQFWPSSTTP